MLLNKLCSNLDNRLKAISSGLLSGVIRTILNGIIEPESTSNRSMEQAVRLLCLLIGTYNRKSYIPGGTSEYLHVREFVMQHGGLLTLLILEDSCPSLPLRQIPQKILFTHLVRQDWKDQLAYLDIHEHIGSDNEKQKRGINFMID